MNTEFLKNKKIVIGAIVVVVLGLVWRGIDGFISNRASETIVEKAIENATGGKADVEIKNGGEDIEYSIKTDEGQITIKSGQDLPANFPDGLEQYPGSEIVTTAETSENNGGQVYMLSSDSVEKISNFYKKLFEDNGWEILATYTMKDATMYSVKAGTLALTVNISPDTSGGKQGIMFIYANE